jgi:hypothetical protein
MGGEVSYNRGNVLSDIGDHRAAQRELERARDLYTSLGYDTAATEAQIELALLPALTGDPVQTLVELDAIDQAPLPDFVGAWLYLHRAEAPLRLRLLPEAREDLDRFEQAVARSGRDDPVNKSRLDAARLALAAGDPEAAMTIAASARRSFAARKQPAFAAAAQLISLAAAVALQQVTRSGVRATRAAVDELTERGWTVDALRGRLIIARAAAESGSLSLLRRELLAARGLERKGTVADRVELRHVEALFLLRLGDKTRGRPGPARRLAATGHVPRGARCPRGTGHDWDARCRSLASRPGDLIGLARPAKSAGLGRAHARQRTPLPRCKAACRPGPTKSSDGAPGRDSKGSRGGGSRTTGERTRRAPNRARSQRPRPPTTRPFDNAAWLAASSSPTSPSTLADRVCVEHRARDTAVRRDTCPREAGAA